MKLLRPMNLSLVLMAINTCTTCPTLLSTLDNVEKPVFIQEALFTPLEIEEVSYCVVHRKKNPDVKQENQPAQSKPLFEDESTQVVLSNFAHVVSHFFNIVANPHNPENVCDSVKEMLCGMVNIAKEAVKNGDIDLNDDDIDEEQLLRYARALSIKLEEPVTRFVLNKSAELAELHDGDLLLS